MINLVLIAIVFYYLLRTGDLFKLVKLARKLVVDLMFSFKRQTQDSFQKESPAEALKLRYVKGEISQSEYERISKT
ncbi:MULTISPECIES: hypothetical protein [Mesobacillus]|uniref:SHOCT domain-containing protein n=1 Tax=Mesobacillus subterraneus TaxID=285983 RepID=A0A0D6ZF26_9BACI|nr:hypothetical protein [Mesobacillus subterraneus]KIY23701.1 hypothetical protein UB32_01635 [Mesobacillus subterraneus]